MRVNISIVIPVYNAGEYLKNCLESILNQTLKYFELIAVDDGSTDDSLKILEKYALCDKRIKLLKQMHLGAGEARNKGLKSASGKYVMFLDADDFF